MTTSIIDEDRVLVEKLSKRYANLSEEEIRADLHAKYAETWNDAELLDEFEVRYFDGPTVQVIRKRDKKTGTVGFISAPRIYFAFIEDEDERLQEI